MPICAAFNCNYKPGRMKIPGRTYHRFPFSRPELLKKWIIKVRRKNWTPNRYSILCSSHFEEDCFYRYGPRVHLNEDAVPTLFDYPIQVSKKRKLSIESICTDYPLQEVSIPNDPEVDAKNVKKEHSYTINPVKLKDTLDEEKMWTNEKCQTMQRVKAKLRQGNSYQRGTRKDPQITEQQTNIKKRILNSIEQETSTENPQIQMSDFSEDSFVCDSPKQDNEASNSDICQIPSFRRKGQKRKWNLSPEVTSFIKELLEQQNHLISEQMSTLNIIADLNKQFINAMTNSEL